MNKKPAGGRGKRESYSTSVVRVPDPIKAKVVELIDAFHQNQPVEGNKPVTGLVEQIPISVVAGMLAGEEPLEIDGEFPPDIRCGYPRIEGNYWIDGWTDEYDKNWESVARPQLEQFNRFADQVNTCIWQIDNSFTISAAGDGYSALALLIEYGLIQFIDEKPATARQLIDWGFAFNFRMDNETRIVKEAILQKRLDILSALEIGHKHPVDRYEYWITKYKSLLGKPNINYWTWIPNPESKRICNEINSLLTLPEPTFNASQVLECLAEGKDPFYKPEVKGDANLLRFFGFIEMGKFGNVEPELKQAYRQAFIEWHLFALNQLGEDVLRNIYRVVYGCNWSLVESIIHSLSGSWWEVLGVSPNASPQEVKKAHRNLAKIWHPDINSDPIAKERMSHINQAFESYQLTCNSF